MFWIDLCFNEQKTAWLFHVNNLLKIRVKIGDKKLAETWRQ